MAHQPVALDQVKLAMAKTNDLFNNQVFGKRDLSALDDIYTADARILPPGAPMISGRDAIKKFWSDLIQSVNAKSAVLASVDVIPPGTAWSKSGAPLSPSNRRDSRPRKWK
jgi:ketosteroid isomerase-like protein